MDLEKLKQSLTKNGFSYREFGSTAEAMDYLDKAIDGTDVGIGGSVTIRDMGLYDRLATHNKVYWHWKQPSNAVPPEAQTAEVFLSSANAIAETGEIVNIDGAGNRIASMLYGHKRIFFIVGMNKITPDYDSAVWRAKNVAAPLNARRLNTGTPCTIKADKCYDCQSPGRICNGMAVLWKKMSKTELMEVVLIRENLGF